MRPRVPHCRAALPLLLAACLCAQQEQVFRAGVALVHVDVSVTAQDGRALTGFSKSDFRVFDNDKEQPILNLAAEEQPLELILLFDISGSMRPKVSEVASAAKAGVSELRDGDRVSIMTFSRRTKVILPFTDNLEQVERSIREDVLDQRFGGGTLIQEAVLQAAHSFQGKPEPGRRRAVLIITDNIGVRTRAEKPIVRDYWEADALLSGLVIENSLGKTMNRVGLVIAPQSMLMRAGMKGIAEKTGGDSIDARDAGGAFQEMMHRIRTRYSLYYAAPPSRPGEERSIRVELSDIAKTRVPGSRAHARHGYIAPKMP